jgi:pimeloyl-ACP methyl ester carboxylesterase
MQLEKIDTAICPFFLVTGEYDFSCAAEDTLRTARSIPGAQVTMMEKLGHFPMSKNPALFRQYVAPVLHQIRQAE